MVREGCKVFSFCFTIRAVTVKSSASLLLRAFLFCSKGLVSIVKMCYYYFYNFCVDYQDLQSSEIHFRGVMWHHSHADIHRRYFVFNIRHKGEVYDKRR